MNFFGKYARLNSREQQVRLGMLDWGLEHGGEIPWAEACRLADEAGGGEALLNSLEERHYFRRTEEGDICYLYPYSAYPTDYQVALADGRQFYAMCAIDAMGSAVTFHQPIEIHSRCRDTKEELTLRLTPEDGLVEISPDDNIIATYYNTSAHYIAFNC